jgi:hypothetical protein
MVKISICALGEYDLPYTQIVGIQKCANLFGIRNIKCCIEKETSMTPG